MWVVRTSHQGRRSITSRISAEPSGHPLQPSDIFLPAVVRAAIVGLVFPAEARLLHAHEGAALAWRERPGDDRPQSTRRLRARRVPAVGEPLVGLDGQDFAVDDTAPM